MRQDALPCFHIHLSLSKQHLQVCEEIAIDGHTAPRSASDPLRDFWDLKKLVWWSLVTSTQCDRSRTVFKKWFTSKVVNIELIKCNWWASYVETMNEQKCKQYTTKTAYEIEAAIQEELLKSATCQSSPNDLSPPATIESKTTVQESREPVPKKIRTDVVYQSDMDECLELEMPLTSLPNPKMWNSVEVFET